MLDSASNRERAEGEMHCKGPWSRGEIDHFLAGTRIPVRLAVNGASGHPILASLWFVHQGDTLWCATQRSSSIVSALTRDPRCAFEVAPEGLPYHGVRGQAHAELHDARGEETLRLLIERYLGDASSPLARWLSSRARSETAIALEPRTLVSWDYRERMGSAAAVLTKGVPEGLPR
jgi:nitroimidazol reductase NimA-like FMN-containing flavoprotein (pyridoxamine 5'-phosphate oxidase superfamily)